MARRGTRIGQAMLAALVLCAVGAVRARAQSGVADIVRRGWVHGHARPPRGFYEMAARPGAFEFRRGWLDRARAVRRNRQALRARGAFNLMNASSAAALSSAATPLAATALTGTLRMPTFIVWFSNTFASDTASAIYDSAAVTAKLWGTASAPPYSSTTYYQEVSGGRMTAAGVVLRPGFRVSRSDSFYSGGPSCGGTCGTSAVPQLISELVAHADSTVDFSKYVDTLTGYVPAIAILAQQVPGECIALNAASRNSIWSHRAAYSWWTGSPIVTNVPWPGHPGQFVKIDDYIITGLQGGSDGCTSGQLMPIGTVTHETGHLFGLPDLYDTDPNFITEGLGHWDLMASGNEQLPYQPAHMSAWSLSVLGWITEVPVTTAQTVTTGPIELSDTAFVVPIAGTPDNEFFLLENRQPIGSDAMMHGPGLMVYHVDTVLMNERLGGNAVNAIQPHAIFILEAAGDTGLNCTYPAACNDRGDAGDPFPGDSDNTKLSAGTNPAATTNAGAFAGLKIDQIQQLAPSGAMSFRVTFGGATVVRASSPGALVRVDGVATPRFQDLLADGEIHAVSMDSSQFSADGRSHFLFVNWSDGLGISHPITGSLAGATYVAQVSAKYLTRYAVTGSGSVSGSRPIDAANGTFFSAGDSVTLTATPSTGQAFLGWTGDTTAAGASLKLRMARPFTVTANFASPRDVVNQLLSGSSPITPAAVLLLDQLGNSNGRFDLGDLVAWLDRNPAIATSPVMLKLLRKLPR